MQGGKGTPRAYHNTPNGKMIWQRVAYSFYMDPKSQWQRLERESL
jgi:hypothetical protein